MDPKSRRDLARARGFTVTQGSVVVFFGRRFDTKYKKAIIIVPIVRRRIEITDKES